MNGGGNDDDDNNDDDEDFEAALEVNAMLIEVEQEMSVELMQTRLEATDALEAVAKFNSVYNLTPMNIVKDNHEKLEDNLNLQSKQQESLYIPSDSDNSEDDEDNENNENNGGKGKKKMSVQTRKVETTKAKRMEEGFTKFEIDGDEEDNDFLQFLDSFVQKPQPTKKSPKTSSKKRRKGSKLPQFPAKSIERISYTYPSGPLGLSLGDCRNEGISTCVIIGVEDYCLSKNIKIGDILDQIGTVSCVGLKFDKVLHLIRTVKRPCTFVFRREKITKSSSPSSLTSPKSKTYVDQPGLIQSPPIPEKHEKLTIPVNKMFEMRMKDEEE